jgi:hypothetical protein
MNKPKSATIEAQGVAITIVADAHAPAHERPEGRRGGF